ncbi:MAG: antibiotic biosynthesis monooxygenase [Acidimicrobiales bacterium]
MSVVLIAKANVASYDRWRNAYDEAAPFRRENGVLHEEIYCSPEDMTSVLVMQTFESVETAKSFTSNPKFTETMNAAGVIGAPHLMITQSI